MPSIMTIRKAELPDLHAVVALDIAVRSAPGQPEHTAEKLKPDPFGRLRDWVIRGECYIAKSNGTMAGFGVFHHHFFHSGMIDLVIVHPSFRRQGVGRALVNGMAEDCKSPKLWTSTNLSNIIMQTLLASEGFKMCGFIEGLDEGDPELIYSRPSNA